MYLLIGAGISNQSVARFFEEIKEEFIIFDDVLLPNFDLSMLEHIKIVVKSPGVYMDHWIVKEALERNIKVITDLELMTYFKLPAHIITITGTLGKTTTTNLIHQIISKIKKVDMIGNMGIPIFDYINSTNDCVIEASSFMLERIEQFHSHCSVLLNLSLAHLDHHKTYVEYVKAKMKLLKNIKIEDVIIYNDDDPLIRRLIDSLDCKKIPFSFKREVEGAYIKENHIYFMKEKIMKTDEIKLLGNHNLENVLAAVATAVISKVPIQSIKEAVYAFHGIKHRIEYFGTLCGKPIYNDSKATNYKAMRTAIQTFINKPLLLICGGKKRIDQIHILDQSIQNIKIVFVIGENAEEMREYFQTRKIKVAKYVDYVEMLKEISFYANMVDVILFSPGASSYDKYKNFEERGNVFKDIISTHSEFQQ